MMVPSSSSLKTVGPNFGLVNYGELPVAIPSHKPMFKATFSPLEDCVDVMQDIPIGGGIKTMEEQLKAIESLNYYEYKDAKAAYLRQDREPEPQSTEVDYIMLLSY